MELTYRLTRDDHMECCKLIRERVASQAASPWGWKRIAALVAAWLALVLLMLVVLAGGVIDEHAAVVAGIAYVAGACSVCLYSWFLQRRYFANLLTDDSPFLSESRVTLDGDGVTDASATRTARYSWRAFSDVTEQAGLIVLWRGRSNGMIVPARVLASDDARPDFVTLVRERIAQAAAA
jgi:hypothetical protein